jgi:hypothetical protein
MLWVFFCNDTLDKGANLTATVLLMLLRAIKSSNTPAALADTLYLQFDGGAENINVYVSQ